MSPGPVGLVSVQEGIPRPTKPLISPMDHSIPVGSNQKTPPGYSAEPCAPASTPYSTTLAGTTAHRVYSNVQSITMPADLLMWVAIPLRGYHALGCSMPQNFSKNSDSGRHLFAIPTATTPESESLCKIRTDTVPSPLDNLNRHRTHMYSTCGHCRCGDNLWPCDRCYSNLPQSR